MIDSDDTLFAECALVVLRGMVVPPVARHDFIQVLPDMVVEDHRATLQRLLAVPKPVACVAVTSSGLLTFGTWTVASESVVDTEDWIEGQLDVVYRLRPLPSGEPCILLCGAAGEVMRLNFEQLLQFQRTYRFPLASRGLRRVGTDPKCEELRGTYGVEATDSVLVYNLLAPAAWVAGKAV